MKKTRKKPRKIIACVSAAIVVISSVISVHAITPDATYHFGNETFSNLFAIKTGHYYVSTHDYVTAKIQIRSVNDKKRYAHGEVFFSQKTRLFGVVGPVEWIPLEDTRNSGWGYCNRMTAHKVEGILTDMNYFCEGLDVWQDYYRPEFDFYSTN